MIEKWALVLMAGMKGAAVRKSTRKAANHDAKANKASEDTGTDAELARTQVEPQDVPSVRRGTRAAAAAKAAAADEAEDSLKAGVARHAEDTAAELDEDEEDDEADTDDQPGSSTDDEAAELDVFDDSTRAAVDSFEAAVAEPAAFLQPSAEISELARAAAKVTCHACHLLLMHASSCAVPNCIPHGVIHQDIISIRQGPVRVGIRVYTMLN